MAFKITLGESAAKMHPEADLYIDNHLAEYGESIRHSLSLKGEILDGTNDDALAARLDAIIEDSAEVVTTLQGRYSLAMIGKVVNRLRDRGVEVKIVIETIPEPIRQQIRAPKVEYHSALEKSSAAPESLRLFLCHCAGDKAEVRKLYHHLVRLGANVWFDEMSLLPGQDWSTEIQAAVRNSDLVLVCLSNRAVRKVGFVQKEIRLALDAADEQPEGSIYIVPVKLEECEVPARLGRWQWVNLFDVTGHDRLEQTLHARAEELRKRGAG